VSETNKIAWLESQYLYPHHFQQQERYFEHLIEQRSRAIQPFIYGFDELVINREKLNEGNFSLTTVSGILPDGCPFDSSVNANPPVPIEIPSTTKNQLIYLALPIYQPGYQFVTTDNEHEKIGRYVLANTDAYDYSSSDVSTESIEIARLQLRLVLENEEMGGFTYLPIARIVEVTAENAIILDSKFIPPVINLKAHNNLSLYLDNVAGLLKQRGNALALRFQNQTTHNSSSISDFLLLQIINRIEPELAHITSIAESVHPERLFFRLISLMGELATFTRAEKRPLSAPKYDHDDLESCFNPVIQNINMHLSSVLEQTALSLPVEKRQYGIYVAPITDFNLLTDSRFVLGVKSTIATNELKSYLPDHLKVGSVNTIRDLVNNQLSGVKVDALSIAPREITYHAGYVYFELDPKSEHWSNLKNAAGFAFHIAGELPELELEFWAIRK
jgi:type VI secretion system protein ImpJ